MAGLQAGRAASIICPVHQGGPRAAWVLWHRGVGGRSPELDAPGAGGRPDGRTARSGCGCSWWGMAPWVGPGSTLARLAHLTGVTTGMIVV